MPRSRAEEDARSEIIRLVMHRTLSPGERVVEQALAEQMELSRTPVRNALRELIAEGFLERLDPKGARVPVLSPEDMKRLFQARGEAEGLAAREAAEAITEEELERLRELFAREEAVYRSWSIDGFTEVNCAFHRGVAEGSHSPYLVRFVQQCFWRSQVYVFFFDQFYLGYREYEGTRVPPGYDFSHEAHRGVLEALADRDAPRARRLMEGHVRETYEALLRRV